MDATVSRLQKAIKDSQKARAEEISIYNPLPPFEEITHPWPLYWKAYRKGDFWSQMKGMPAWKSRPQTNIPFQVVETNTTLLTDARPTAVPFSDSGHTDDYYLAEWLKSAYLQWWNEQYGDLKVTLGVKYSRIFGLGWLRLDTEKGKQELETVHPDQIYVSPDTTIDSIMVREPTYLIYEYEAQVGSLRKRYKKRSIKWDEFSSEWDVSVDYERLRPMDQSERFQPTKVVKVYQIWEQDPTEVEWKESIGDSEVTKSKPKYPGGKVTTIAGGIVLEEKANPYKHKHYPFTPIFAYVAPGQFYPVGDIQNIWPLVIMRNRLMQQNFDQMIKAGGGKILVGKGAGNPEFSNAPYEQVNVPGDINQIRFESAPQPSRSSLEYVSVIDRDIDNTAGIHDISRGARTAGNPVTAQEAMMLGESDRTRIRLASRLLTWSLNRMGRQWCYNAAQFTADKEYVAKVISDPNEEIPRLEGATTVPVAYSPKDIMVDGKIEEGLKYGIKFAEFSTLPQSLNEDKQLALNLFEMGLLDPEDLLLALDWPNARAIAQKAMQKQEQQAQMQAQQQAMTPQGVPEMGQAVPEQGTPELPPEIQAAMDQMVQQGMSPEEAAQAIMEMMG